MSDCDLCAGECRGHSLGHPEEWKPEPGSKAWKEASPVTDGVGALKPNWAEMIRRDECPVEGCGGVLDTGWECLRCHFDASLVVWTEGAAKQ